MDDGAKTIDHYRGAAAPRLASKRSVFVSIRVEENVIEHRKPSGRTRGTKAPMLAGFHSDVEIGCCYWQHACTTTTPSNAGWRGAGALRPGMRVLDVGAAAPAMCRLRWPPAGSRARRNQLMGVEPPRRRESSRGGPGPPPTGAALGHGPCQVVGSVSEPGHRCRTSTFDERSGRRVSGG